MTLLGAQTYEQIKVGNALTRVFPILSRFASETSPGLKAIQTSLGGIGSGIGSVQTKFPFSSGVYNIGHAEIIPKLQGLGLGRKMYGSTIRKAFEDYRQTGANRYFTSDSTGGTSDKAVNMWESLKRRGWPIQTNPGFTPKSEAVYGIDLEQAKNFFKDKT